MRARHLRWLFAVPAMVAALRAIVVSGEPATVGVSLEWSDEGYRFAVGIGPWALGIAAINAGLYVLLVSATPSVSGVSFSGGFRRFVAFWIDFAIGMSVLVPVTGILPVVLEWRRVGVFALSFERSTPAPADVTLAVVSGVIVSAGLLLYHAIPIARGRPSPGTCIMGYQVTPEGGGGLPLRRLLLRAFVRRDRRGRRSWFDRVLGTRATLLD